jgi:hypothetical protein
MVRWIGPCTGGACVKDETDYAVLSERLTVDRPYRAPLPQAEDERRNCCFRTRVLNNWNEAWRFLSSRTAEPHMVTMARGKSADLGPLHPVWRDAYAAISRAKTLEIVGYSMPDDDAFSIIGSAPTTRR